MLRNNIFKQIYVDNKLNLNLIWEFVKKSSIITLKIEERIYFMDVIKTKIGDVVVLIESCDNKLTVHDSERLGSGLQNTMKTGVKQTTEKIADAAFEELKKIISNMARSCEEELEEHINKPDEFTLEFSLSFSAKNSLWILGCESNAVMKVGMKWKAKDVQ